MEFVEETKKRSLTVAPFECAWGEELRFREPGRGCVSFEASAHNDVTLVFRHHPGSHHYHYKMDTSRHYTVILGSHRNKRLRIQVDGATVADVAAPGLCCSNSFQAFWITICDGLITIGQGRHPNTNLLFQWLDPDPNPDVQYVGLSSWDKHVGYRNISILPAAPQYSILWTQKLLCCGKPGTADDSDQRLLADFLESWDLSDAVFVVGTERKLVPAHRIVLCASGDFPFQIADHGATIQLPSVSYPLLHSLLEYIYTGSTQDTVCSVLQAVSSIPSCKLLEEVCKRNFATHFDYCTTACTDFVLLDEATFKDILQHGDMTVTSEERVLDAILTWCMGTCETFYWTSVDKLLRTSTPEQLFGERLSAIDTLLPFVRFPLMQLSMLKRMEISNLANHIQVFRQLVAEAIEFSHAGQWTPTSYECERFQHRRSSYKELQYISDGDSNGVIYYAGTSFGKHQWMNPVLAKNITVVASSPNSRHTDPKALVSKNYQGTCFAGPCIEDGKKISWWMVDIGQDHQLMCNYYTVRQDGSTTFMRSWVLQGSMDGRNWTSLRVHEEDATICHPGQFASWPVVGPPALLPFRFFRVALTGPAAGGSVSNAWNLCICFLELYGYLR